MLPIKSKYKIAKRLGGHLFEQTQTQKYALSEARAKKRKVSRRAGSDFSKQLLEKQRMRYTYGLSERQLANYVARAMEHTNPPQALHEALELRLDNLAYRAGFAPTRRAARQAASHGHFTVSGKRVTAPSRRLMKDDAFNVRDKSRASSLYSALASGDNKDARSAPAWLSVDMPALSAQVTAIPEHASAAEGTLDYRLVFEFYSR